MFCFHNKQFLESELRKRSEALRSVGQIYLVSSFVQIGVLTLFYLGVKFPAFPPPPNIFFNQHENLTHCTKFSFTRFSKVSSPYIPHDKVVILVIFWNHLHYFYRLETSREVVTRQKYWIALSWRQNDVLSLIYTVIMTDFSNFDPFDAPLKLQPK